MEGICWKKVFLSLSCCCSSFSMWLYWSNNPYYLTNSFLELAKNRLFNRCEGGISKTHPLQSNRQDCDSYFAHRPLSLIFVYWREQFTHWVFTKHTEQQSFKTYIILANNPDLGGSQSPAMRHNGMKKVGRLFSSQPSLACIAGALPPTVQLH